uniref:Uncharacterized protein n=1 Tax=Rhizophora mucronata TaxID=61149 RepID=A0A2P2Q5C8_RHIMU
MTLLHTLQVPNNLYMCLRVYEQEQQLTITIVRLKRKKYEQHCHLVILFYQHLAI